MKKINTTYIIDDDHIYLFGIKHIIKTTNFSESFMVFNNGKEAIESLKSILTKGENTPDIILLDLNMPIMDGWQFLDEFEKIQNNKTKVFIISSSINPADIEKAKNYNTVVDYVLKPISKEKIENISKTYALL